MSQAWHIVRKDLRHLWPFIAAIHGSMIATAWIYPTSWNWGEIERSSAIEFWGITIRPELILLLIPLTAWLLVTRMMQEEPLVGDRHFWLTRPYRWQQLLLARLLFYVLVVMAPFIVMQMIVIHRAELPVLASLPLLFVNASTLSLLLLPFAVIAVVTRTFVQALFTLIGTIIYVAVCIGLALQIDSIEFNPSPDGPLFIAFLVLVPVGIIVVQFASRRVYWSRAAVGIFLAIVGVTAVVPMGRITVPMDYPVQGNVLLRFDSDSSRKLKNLRVDPKGNKVMIRLPLASGGVVLDHSYSTSGLFVTLHGENGMQWASGWLPQIWNLKPGSNTEAADFTLPRSVYERMKDTAVHAEIQLAIRETVMGGVTTAVFKEGWNDLPEIGRCRASNLSTSVLECRTAIWEPYTAELGVTLSNEGCDGSPMHSTATNSIYASGESARVLPMSLPGVWVNRLSPLHTDFREDRATQYVCPGSKIRIRRIMEGGRSRVIAEADGIHLVEYAGYVPKEHVEIRVDPK